MTALRETPIAAAIWLQVMPLPMQLRSCSMRSGVQVAVEGAPEGAVLLLAGAMIAGSIAGDGIGSDGAVDGDMRRPRSRAAAGLGRRQGVCPRAAGNRETQTSKRKSVRGFKKPIWKDCPRRRWQPVRRKSQPHQATTPHFTEPHPASRMANPLSEWTRTPLLNRGRFLSLLSENPRRIEASHDSTRLPRVKMPL